MIDFVDFRIQRGIGCPVGSMRGFTMEGSFGVGGLMGDERLFGNVVKYEMMRKEGLWFGKAS